MLKKTDVERKKNKQKTKYFNIILREDKVHNMRMKEISDIKGISEAVELYSGTVWEEYGLNSYLISQMKSYYNFI